MTHERDSIFMRDGGNIGLEGKSDTCKIWARVPSKNRSTGRQKDGRQGASLATKSVWGKNCFKYNQFEYAVCRGLIFFASSFF